MEIAGFFAAIFAWGNRTTIIQKSKELMLLMDNSPYDFCKNHRDEDLKALLGFKHRTFNATDLLYFISFFQHHYNKYDSLEKAFTLHGKTVEEMFVVSSLFLFRWKMFRQERRNMSPHPREVNL